MGWIFLESIGQHVYRLRRRSMTVRNVEAEQWFSNVSYYRLSAYWYPARKIAADGSTRADEFVPDTNFSDVTRLYEADRKLRTLIHDGMERIEIAMRTQITETLCAKQPNEPDFYLSSGGFRTRFDHVGWLSTIYGRLNHGKKNEAVKHYAAEYGGRYPLWVLAEVMDFSDMSRLFAELGNNDQRKIAENLDLHINFNTLSNNQRDKSSKGHPLASWLEQLTVVRNICAHHGRLWNKSFAPASAEILKHNGNLHLIPGPQNERIFGSMVFMSHLLRKISPGTTWPEKVIHLLTDSFLPNPLVRANSLGIPQGWDQQTI
ncbi:Abi family protein [Corynebacterium cystitidis]|uniref:Abi family protein n=1 Tax=Corynebacterium cystitidis TaxID=35757 RepID=UPI00211EA9AC|nr:Abi family protein [Corynebacterium cystitidis]